MELILTISAVKRAGAASVTCIMPYYGYARQDRKFQSQNVPISGADAA
jgi:ribose-phosphate pyrophosphokinase